MKHLVLLFAVLFTFTLIGLHVPTAKAGSPRPVPVAFQQTGIQCLTPLGMPVSISQASFLAINGRPGIRFVIKNPEARTFSQFQATLYMLDSQNRIAGASGWVVPTSFVNSEFLFELDDLEVIPEAHFALVLNQVVVPGPDKDPYQYFLEERYVSPMVGGEPAPSTYALWPSSVNLCSVERSRAEMGCAGTVTRWNCSVRNGRAYFTYRCVGSSS